MPIFRFINVITFKMKIADICQDTALSTPPVFHPTDCKLTTMNPVTSAELRHIILASPPKSFWHHQENFENLTLYRPFCYKSLSMIDFCFSLFAVTGQFRTEFYHCRRSAQSWFLSSSEANLTQLIRSILDRLLMCLLCLRGHPFM